MIFNAPPISVKYVIFELKNDKIIQSDVNQGDGFSSEEEAENAIVEAIHNTHPDTRNFFVAKLWKGL